MVVAGSVKAFRCEEKKGKEREQRDRRGMGDFVVGCGSRARGRPFFRRQATRLPGTSPVDLPDGIIIMCENWQSSFGKIA